MVDGRRNCSLDRAIDNLVLRQRVLPFVPLVARWVLHVLKYPVFDGSPDILHVSIHCFRQLWFLGLCLWLRMQNLIEEGGLWLLVQSLCSVLVHWPVVCQDVYKLLLMCRNLRLVQLNLT